MVYFILFGFALIGIATAAILIFTFLPSKTMGDVLSKFRPEEGRKDEVASTAGGPARSQRSRARPSGFYRWNAGGKEVVSVNVLVPD